MSFADRVEEKRLQHEAEAARQWQAVLDAASDPAMVAKIEPYRAALETLTQDLGASSGFRALFGEAQPVVRLSRPDDMFVVIGEGEMTGWGLTELRNPRGLVASLSCGSRETAARSRDDCQLSIRVESIEGAREVMCHAHVVGNYDSTKPLHRGRFGDMGSSEFTAASAEELVAKVDDYLTDFVARMQPSIERRRARTAAGSADASSGEPDDGGPGLIGRLFRR